MKIFKILVFAIILVSLYSISVSACIDGQTETVYTNENCGGTRECNEGVWGSASGGDRCEYYESCSNRNCEFDTEKFDWKNGDFSIFNDDMTYYDGQKMTLYEILYENIELVKDLIRVPDETFDRLMEDRYEVLVNIDIETKDCYIEEDGYLMLMDCGGKKVDMLQFGYYLEFGPPEFNIKITDNGFSFIGESQLNINLPRVSDIEINFHEGYEADDIKYIALYYEHNSIEIPLKYTVNSERRGGIHEITINHYEELEINGEYHNNILKIENGCEKIKIEGHVFMEGTYYFTSEGNIVGKTDYVDGIRFSEDSDVFIDGFTIKINDVTIESIEIDELLEVMMSIEGKNINFKNDGFVLNEGEIKVSSREGIYYVDDGKKAIINNIEIINDIFGRTSSYGRYICLNFGDEKIGEDNIVEFKNNEINIIGFEDTVAEIIFRNGNDLMQVDENDKFVVHPSGGEANIKNENGKTIVNIKGDVNLENDDYSLFYTAEEEVKVLTSKLFNNEYTSVPMDIYYFDEDGNSVLSDIYGKPIGFEMNNNNELNSNNKEVKSDSYSTSYFQGYNFLQIYKTNEEGRTVRDLLLSGMSLSDFHDYMDMFYDMTPEMRESVSMIQIIENQYLLGGHATLGNIEVTEEYQFDFGITSHEVAHTLTFALDENNNNKFSNDWISIATNNGELSYDEIYVGRDKVLDDYINKMRGEDIDDNSIQKGVVGGSYGTVNHYEDIATMTQKLYANPENVLDAMIQNPIIKDKLDLLYKYDFISKDQYYELINLYHKEIRRSEKIN